MWKEAGAGAVGGAIAGAIVGATVDTGGVAGAIIAGAIAGGAGNYSEQVTGNLFDGGGLDSFSDVNGVEIAQSALVGGFVCGVGKALSKPLGKLANKGLTKLNSAKLQAGKTGSKIGTTLNSLHATGKELVNGSEEVGAKVVAPTISNIANKGLNTGMKAAYDWASNFGSGGSGNDSSGGDDSDSDDSDDSDDNDDDND